MTSETNPDGEIHGICMVRNEADIIEASLRWNLRFVDHIHLIDDGSSDGTYAILEALAAETGKLTLSQIAKSGFHKDRVQPDYMRDHMVALNLAHVVVIDADEFLLGDPEAFRAYLRDAVEPVGLPWRTYIPMPGDHANVNPLLRITHRRSIEKPQYIKVTVPHRFIGNAELEFGAHCLEIDGERRVPDRNHPFTMAHFPIRSSDQLMAKVLIGCWNVALNPRRTETSGQHWRKIAADFVRHGRPDAHALRDHALAYATRQESEPVPDPVQGAEVIEIKYAALADTRLLPKLIAFTDALVAETVAARQSQGESGD